MRKRQRPKKHTRLRRQVLKSQKRRGNHMTQGVDEHIGILSAIEAKFHLAQISRKMAQQPICLTKNKEAPCHLRTIFI